MRRYKAMIATRIASPRALIPVTVDTVGTQLNKEMRSKNKSVGTPRTSLTPVEPHL